MSKFSLSFFGPARKRESCSPVYMCRCNLFSLFSPSSFFVFPLILLLLWWNTSKLGIEGTTDTCPQGRGLGVRPSFFSLSCCCMCVCVYGKWLREWSTIGQVNRPFARLITTFLPGNRRRVTGFVLKKPSSQLSESGQDLNDPSNDEMSTRWSARAGPPGRHSWPPPPPLFFPAGYFPFSHFSGWLPSDTECGQCTARAGQKRC